MTPPPMNPGSALMRDDLALVRSYVPRYDASAGADRLADALAKTGAIGAAGGAAVATTKTAVAAAAPLRLALLRWLSFLLGPSLLVTGGALTVHGVELQRELGRDASGSALLAPAPELAAAADPPAPRGRSAIAPSEVPAPSPSPTARPAPTLSGRRPRSIAAELRDLAALKRLLARDPDAALKRLERAPADRGRVLSEEREIMTIEALVATGRKTEARRRARTFVAAHPQSGYAPRARAIADEPG